MYKSGLDYAYGKTQYSTWRSLILGIMGGFFVGIGYIGYHTILSKSHGHLDPTGKFLAGLMFPAGLMLIVFLGGNLFTSHTLIMLPMFEGKVSVRTLLKEFGLALLGNMLGCMLTAIIAAYSGHYDMPSTKAMTDIQNVLDTHKGASAAVIHSELAKLTYDASQYKILESGHVANLGTNYGWALVIADGKDNMSHWWNYGLSAILCNVLVAGTVWMAMTVKEQKSAVAIIVIFMIMFFAVAGFQHVVANMYAYFIVLFKNPDWINNTGFIFGNLLPVMVGNFIGGGVILPVAYFFVFGENKKFNIKF